MDINAVFVMMLSRAKNSAEAFAKNVELKTLASEMFDSIFPNGGSGEDRTAAGKKRAGEAVAKVMPDVSVSFWDKPSVLFEEEEDESSADNDLYVLKEAMEN